MLDAWIIDKLRKEQEKPAEYGIPLYAPQPLPPEAREPKQKEPAPAPRGVIEDLDSVFRI